MAWESIGPAGEVFTAHLYPNGMYRVADPALGDEKHHAKNQFSVREDQIEAYLRRGFLLRMKSAESGKVVLIEADQIKEI